MKKNGPFRMNKKTEASSTYDIFNETLFQCLKKLNLQKTSIKI